LDRRTTEELKFVVRNLIPTGEEQARWICQTAGRLLQNPEIKKRMDEADGEERRQARLALKRWEESRKTM